MLDSSATAAAHISDEPSVAKTLSQLMSVSSNRSCADCRSTLVDPSQVHASVSPDREVKNAMSLEYSSFKRNHQSFAPPGHSSPGITDAYDPPTDPALLVTRRIGSHGVFVCAPCAAAHKLLGPNVAIVHAVQDHTSWTPVDVKRLASSGGNYRSWTVLEAYLSSAWESKRPKSDSSIADRLSFVRAKYEALAFVLPPPGPLAFGAWQRIVTMHPEWKGLLRADLHALSEHDLRPPTLQRSAGSHSLIPKSTVPAVRRAELPDRFVDFFFVVHASDYLDQSLLRRDLSTLRSPEEMLLIPKVADCFPSPDAYENELEFPEHVSTFLFPDGCTPSMRSQAPSFFTFVLTSSSGDRLYGGVLRLYEENRDVEYLREVVVNSGYQGKWPTWLEDGRVNLNLSTRSKRSISSDVIFLPKCLVVISHYPFFDIWRKFLLQIYRIALTEAPLPIERFIANFTCEIPLPPPGRIQVKFGFTVKDTWSIERPPDNRLPMANFSYQPLFATLSIPNILVVFGCLLQEARVALVSSHYSLLCPVAEALTSLLFPLHWEGMYLPIMPYCMLDILDAPVPYLVGLHSRYLVENHPGRRPHGVVFVDLDRDEVHLGFDDVTNSPREIPCLPERQATKLKTKLEEFASGVYVMPPSTRVANLTTAEGEPYPTSARFAYLQWDIPDSRCVTTRPRRDIFGNADKAYKENELQVPISGFLSEHGQYYAVETPSASTPSHRMRFGFLRRTGSNAMDSLDSFDLASVQSESILDLDDPPGFSSPEIRRSFLRFFVALFLDYRSHLGEGEFQAEHFVAGLYCSAASSAFTRRLLKTQMFDRFKEERRESPNDPEVRFFDESIAEKRRRSKVNTLANIRRSGKKVPSSMFLQDTSSVVTDTFTPPPPSNWGLPDDGRSYCYGTFPTMNADLFGKVRPPRKWATNRRGSLRMNRRMSTSTATRASEQAVFAKAMAPVVGPGSFILAASVRGAKNLEHAIGALSMPFMSSNLSSMMPSRRSDRDFDGAGNSTRSSIVSDVTMASEFGFSRDVVDSAEEVVLNARRKQSILVGILMVFQAESHRHIETSQYRRSLRKKSLNGAHQRKQRSERDSIVLLQGSFRSFAARSRFRDRRESASLLQAFVRGRRIRFAFELLRETAINLERVSRGFLARRRLTFVLNSRMDLYRRHIFSLWRVSHTSLCFRTKFWDFIQNDRIILMALAEQEIRRLWKLLAIAPPVKRLSDFAERGPYAKIASRLGLNDGFDASVVQIDSLLATDVQLTNSACALASARESAERIQVYERLSASIVAQEDRLNVYFQRFAVPLKDRLKKVSLAEIIWKVFDQAGDSTTLVLELFPELKESSNIHFRDPSKKGIRRLKHNSIILPGPLEPDECAHNVLQDRIRRNVVEVADLSLRRVSQLSVKLAIPHAVDPGSGYQKAELRKAKMRATRTANWRVCRLVIVRGFVSRHMRSSIQKKASKNPFDSHGGKENYPGENFWESDESSERRSRLPGVMMDSSYAL